jgi:hypothetical protein
MSIIATGQVVNLPTRFETNLLGRGVAVLYHWKWDWDAIDPVIGEAIPMASVTAVADPVPVAQINRCECLLLT